MGKAYGTAINLPAGRQTYELKGKSEKTDFLHKDKLESGFPYQHASSTPEDKLHYRKSKTLQRLQGKGARTLEERAVKGERHLANAVPHKGKGGRADQMKDTLLPSVAREDDSSLQGGGIVPGSRTTGNDHIEPSVQRHKFSRKRAGASILAASKKPSRASKKVQRPPYSVDNTFSSGGKNPRPLVKGMK